MELLKIVFLSVGAFVTLFVLTKIMGNRQMSQLSMFDYINGITIGSIAAEMATSLDSDFKEPLVAMAIFAGLSLLTAWLTSKSVLARRLMTGKPVIIYEKGTIYEKNLAGAHLDINEFLTQCRNSGYFDLNDLHTVILETNGRMSFMPAANSRPVTPEDLKLSPRQETPLANVVIDGHVMHKNLKNTGNNEKWLASQLSAQGAGNIKDVFLATRDCNNKLTVYKKTREKMRRDIFE